MTTLYTAPETTSQTTNNAAAYAWYLHNRDEINEIAEGSLLETLQNLETELSLTPGTATRFKAIRDEASNIPENQEVRYLAAWDAYHDALDNDKEMNELARVYGQRVRLPLYDRIDNTGRFTV